MGWQQVQEAVRLAIAEAIGQPDRLGADGVNYVRQVEWENRASASRDTGTGQPWVNLRLGAVREVHRSETIRTFVDTGDVETSTQSTTVCGTREFVVTVEIGVENQEPGAEAVGFLADRLRTRLRRADVLEDLQAANVAHIGTDGTTNADFMDMDGRMCSRSVTDIRFRTVSSDTQTDGGWIAGASGAGEGDIDQISIDV